MSKRVKWSYNAGKWVIACVDDEDNPYECPTTTDPKSFGKTHETRRVRIGKKT